MTTSLMIHIFDFCVKVHKLLLQLAKPFAPIVL